MAISDINTDKADLALQQRLLARLRAFLPEESILHTIDQCKPYECDGLSAYTQMPLLVVSPTTSDQVQDIVQECYALNVPIVPRGSGTGLSGGALPHPNGITLNFSKMNKILKIDPQNRTATVQPGVINIKISEMAEQYGLYFAPDPSSQIACSIGGNFAENAGGLHCLKYGLTINNVLAAKIVLPQGERIEIGHNTLQQNGLDLLAMFIGSEGLLGVVTEITVRLLPRPYGERVLVAGFTTVREAADCVGSIISTGVIPAALEMMDQTIMHAVEEYTNCGYPIDSEALLLCEVDGLPEEIEEQVKIVQHIMQTHRANNIQISNSEQERQQFWLGRKAAFPAAGSISPDYYCLDGTVPRRHIGEVLAKIQEFSKQYGLRVANVFHAGDGNLHPLILYDNSVEGQLELCEELGDKILQTCVQFGGTISGEHGVGLEKIGSMCRQFNSQEIVQFQEFKRAFDEREIMNPGKNIPTLNRCAEFGAMHVHRLDDKYPNLPRW